MIYLPNSHIFLARKMYVVLTIYCLNLLLNSTKIINVLKLKKKGGDSRKGKKRKRDKLKAKKFTETSLQAP